MEEIDLIVGEKDKFLKLFAFAMSNGWVRIDNRTVTNVRGKLIYSVLVAKPKTDKDEEE